MKGISAKKGFTLIEFIVVISILVILAVIAVPRYINALNYAKQETDKASVAILNNSTAAYGLMRTQTSSDIFEGIENDAARIQKLVDESYLDEVIEPNQNAAEFNWVVEDQIWVLSGGA